MDEEQEKKNCESKIYVWWDIQRCVIPSGYDALRIYGAIKAAMNKLGFCGALVVEAVGEMRCVNKELNDRFLATGIRFVPVCLGVDFCNEHKIFNSIIKRKNSPHQEDLPEGSVVVIISGYIGYVPFLSTLKEDGFVPFMFSKSDWCNVLALGPLLDPRQFGFPLLMEPREKEGRKPYLLV